ncbi:hypothetical protein [Candidatus Villigracilis affinis]|uniref:hypothetical protein n=1 Tax=Candidatus Villigracilis affinis TaxID=3140682 RepID=UPI0031F0DBBB
MNKCQDCHDVHALEPKVESCETCHDTTDPLAIRESDVDYDGDGDVTEGIKGEVDTLAEALYAQMQNYAAANGGANRIQPRRLPVLLLVLTVANPMQRWTPPPAPGGLQLSI